MSADEPGFPSIYKAEFMVSYDANNARVIKTVPRDRLLIQDHRNGWTQLCEFLGKTIPQTSYPHVNSRAEFKYFLRNLGLGVAGTGVIALVVLGLAVKFVISLFASGKKVKGA